MYSMTRSLNRSRSLALGCALLFLALASNNGSAGVTEDQFITPPASARPWVYWFWLDGNVTKEGVTADLEAMQRVGLGGALWMWGAGVGQGVQGPVKFLGPEWWELMRHTVREADRLGLMLNLTVGSGWSHSGGPWVKPEHSMQRLELSQEIRLQGRGLQDVPIAGGDELVAILAYPVKGDRNTMREAGVKIVPSSTAQGFPVAKALDQDPTTRWISKGSKAGDGPTETHPESLAFEFPNPYAAAALYIAPFYDCGPRQCQLQFSTDGTHYETICRFELSPNTPRTIPFESPAARFFRLLITSAHPFQGQESWNVQIAEIQLLQHGEQPLGHVTLDSRSLVDLTSKLNPASGRLAWESTPGNWKLQVYRHGSTGDRPHPTGEGGLECDKLSPAAVEANWNGFLRRVLDECGPAARRVIRYAHADSYEFQPQTWTPRFREEFKQRCGYDPIPYLPVIVGQEVDNAEISARFLWDFKRVRADLFAEGMGGHLRDLCRREGIALTTEPHLVPDVFDQIQYGGHVSEPVGNFLGERRTHWYADNPPVGPEVQLAKGEASAAYTYGLNGVVWAEAFTGVDHKHAWKETPEYLRTWGDLWLTEGINRITFHCWAHSPSLDQKPGITLGPWGIHFDRRNTWFELATGYLTCLSRCQYLLQQGLPVADVCVFTGDGVTAEFPRHPELRANGYDYHGLTTEVLLQTTTVSNGWLRLPSGMQYRLLATYNRDLRPHTLRKLRDLVAAGATIVGPKPENAPGLVGYPDNQVEVQRIADELWGADIAAGRRGRKFGHGRVFWGEPEKPVQGTHGCGIAAYLECTRELQVLRAIGVGPDFEYSQTGKENCDAMLAYAHRRLPDGDWYFVSNQAGHARKENCAFRIAGRQPELWDPVTGQRRDLPVFQEVAGRMTVSLEFAAGQSYFVVFRKATERKAVRPNRENFATLKTVSELTGDWQVTFDPKWGGPGEPVIFQTLGNWAQHADEAVKFYSGTAVYRKTFELTAKSSSSPLFLDLGKVKDVAEVRLNGRTLGTVWCEPRRIEITGAARAGDNELLVVVANEWVNRLIGDSRLPPEKRFTWTTWNPYEPNSVLLPSGLLGPVRLETVEAVRPSPADRNP